MTEEEAGTKFPEEVKDTVQVSDNGGGDGLES